VESVLPTVAIHFAFQRVELPRHRFEQRALSGAVATQNPNSRIEPNIKVERLREGVLGFVSVDRVFASASPPLKNTNFS
jgi:hypothetical protein